jgi:hypothetical protein
MKRRIVVGDQPFEDGEPVKSPPEPKPSNVPLDQYGHQVFDPAAYDPSLRPFGGHDMRACPHCSHRLAVHLATAAERPYHCSSCGCRVSQDEINDFYGPHGGTDGDAALIGLQGAQGPTGAQGSLSPMSAPSEMHVHTPPGPPPPSTAPNPGRRLGLSGTARLLATTCRCGHNQSDHESSGHGRCDIRVPPCGCLEYDSRPFATITVINPCRCGHDRAQHEITYTTGGEQGGNGRCCALDLTVMNQERCRCRAYQPLTVTGGRQYQPSLTDRFWVMIDRVFVPSLWKPSRWHQIDLRPWAADLLVLMMIGGFLMTAVYVFAVVLKAR